jgi:hypothetical protein
MHNHPGHPQHPCQSWPYHPNHLSENFDFTSLANKKKKMHDHRGHQWLGVVHPLRGYVQVRL